MAQKTEEETEFKVPESTLSLCVNNCGFTGNPATNNMCQKCFKTASTSTTGILPSHNKVSVPETSRSGSPGSPDRPFAVIERRGLKDRNRTPAVEAAAGGRSSQATAPVNREVNRCSGCRRKVGLTGFRCRCGDLFCAEHRYSDRHDCSYDYKAAGREAIARENPVVKAAKIVKSKNDDTRCWKALLNVRDTMIPFIAMDMDGQCDFLGVKQNSVKRAYSALRGCGDKAVWAKMVWSVEIFPLHQFILWHAMRNKWRTRVYSWGCLTLCEQ
ncbi:switch-activating protein Sap1 [Dionaea muscipula]